MKLSRVFLLAVLVSLPVITVHADVIPGDARIIVGHGTDPNDCGTESPSFKINGNGNGGGVKNCQNTTGQDWVGLTIKGMTKAGESIKCKGDLGDIFTSCKIQTTLEGKKQLVTITLTGGGEITANSFFFLDLNDSGGPGNGHGGWEGQLTVTPMLETAPEPGTIILLLIGFGGIWLWRKLGSSPETNI